MTLCYITKNLNSNLKKTKFQFLLKIKAPNLNKQKLSQILFNVKVKTS